ncbi:MAG: dockerin type I repeat-containing protein [Candidatus Zixiibacteriota bacterium]
MGDATSDGAVDAGDVVYIINYLYRGGPAPTPLVTADVTHDAILDVSDLIYLINYLYRSGSVPSCP